MSQIEESVQGRNKSSDSAGTVCLAGLSSEDNDGKNS